jgi:glyoxylase-like metal-dependent hydrolase (beta-lactamase superfamily II)
MVEGGGAPFLGIERNACGIDRVVKDGDEIQAGEMRIGVMHSPGHTAGSVCYTVGETLFSGDVLFKGSIGRTDLPGGSDQDMMQTLRNRIGVLDGATHVYPGHGPDTTIEHEKMFNPFLR